jgi:multiple sugar transport system ATP-binding protein
VAVMRHGVLEQVGSPMELYNHPNSLFVAGFIGSPGMNFLAATIENGIAHLPMVDVTLPQHLRERLGRRADGRKVIAGIRPENFEDAAVVPRESRDRGTTFRARLDLVEAMGAEYYAHFGVKAEHLATEDLEELRHDQDDVEETTDTGDEVVVARLDPASHVRAGELTELWLDATKLHFFDAESGNSLTERP